MIPNLLKFWGRVIIPKTQIPNAKIMNGQNPLRVQKNSDFCDPNHYG